MISKDLYDTRTHQKKAVKNQALFGEIPLYFYAKMTSKWQVYILKCSDETLYTGITNFLDRRIKAHNDGTASKYTRSRRPVELVYLENKRSRSTASVREAQIKAMTKREKLNLIGGRGRG
jgi:putative endonuclease